jgi:hypothetical protein
VSEEEEEEESEEEEEGEEGREGGGGRGRRRPCWAACVCFWEGKKRRQGLK